MSAATTAITTAITMVVVGSLYAALNRGADRPASWDPHTETIELRHGALIRKVLPAALLLLTGAFVVGVVHGVTEGDTRLVVLSVSMASIFGAGAWWAAGEARSRILVDGKSVRWVRASGVETAMAWSEISRVHYSAFWGGLILQDRQGQKVRVSMFLVGFSLFVALLKKSLEPKRTRDALAKLQEVRRRLGGS